MAHRKISAGDDDHGSLDEASTRQPAGVLVVKTTVNLPADIVEAMRELAKTRNTTLGKIISDAISLEQYVHEQTKRGGRLVVEQPDNTRTYLWIR